MTVAMTGLHRGRFGAAMDEFRRRRGAEPDRAWRALVLLTTAVPGFWERVREHIDWDALTLDPASVPVASYDEVRLLRVAANLLQGQGAIVVRSGPERADRDDPAAPASGTVTPAGGTATPAGGGGAARIDGGGRVHDDVGVDDRRGDLAPRHSPAFGVDVRELADRMDGALWRVVMLAWEEYQKRG